MTEIEPGGASGARERQRRARARRRNGKKVFPLELCEAEQITALIVSGALSEAQALRPELVVAALAEVQREWARRWCETRHA